MTGPQAKHRLDYTPSPFTISELSLNFRLEPTKTRVGANSQVTRVVAGATTLTLDGESQKLIRILIDGQPLAETHYSVSENALELTVDKDQFELYIETEIDPENNTALEGLYRSEGTFCTQCEAEGFRRITYFLDRPDVLAVYTTRIEAPKADYPFLLANGNKIDSGELDDGWHFATWHDPYPKPSYLFALVAGQFDLLEDEFVTKSGRKVALELFVDPGQASRGVHAMESLKRAMRWDEERFNLEYDLNIYMVVAVDFFNMGAMENKGLNIFNSKCVLADEDSATDKEFHRIESIIGHEYFHNWTGNRITCRDWFQLSLKEGLTVFRDQEFSSDLGSRAVNRIDAVKTIRGVQFAEDAGPMAHPIRPEQVIEMNNFYTVTVYDKGSEVIRMMHTLLGEEGFQKGMACYVSRHDGQAATCDDFVQAMEDASGVDLTQFRLWYSQSGTPELSVSESFDVASGEYRLQFSQHTAPTADQTEKQPLHLPIKMELLDAQGKLLDATTKAGDFDGLFSLTAAEAELVFTGLKEKPVASLLQEFSAPVKLHFAQPTAELCLVMANASNAVARWDAAQSLLMAAIEADFDDAAAELSPELVSAFAKVLLDEQLDPALMAELITLPSVSSLLDAKPGRDITKLFQARQQVQRKLKHALSTECDVAWQRVNAQDAANRAAKGALLLWYALAGDETKVQAQFDNATNMTDTLAALTAANQGLLSCRESMMSAFEAKWRHDPLVMDKWFTQLAITPESVETVLAKINQAMEHEQFAISNPNRVRALVGAFAEANPMAFHDDSGLGYAFLGEQLMQLNGINPQCAARIITPLIGFKRHSDERQSLMRAQLEQLLAMDDLSKDLFEKVSKSLK